MKWLFSQDLFKTQQAFRCDVSTLILWCLTTTTSQRDVPFSNLSNFKAEILSGSFDSRHLSSTTAVHEGKAILYSQIFTVVTWTAMQFFGFWARLSITNPYVLHPAAEACLSMLTYLWTPSLWPSFLVYEKRKWYSYFSSNDKHHMLPSSKPILQSYQPQEMGLHCSFTLIVKVAHVPGICVKVNKSQTIASFKPQTHKVGNCCAPLTLEFWSKSLVSCRVSRAKVPDFGPESWTFQLTTEIFYKKNIYKTRLNVTSQPRIASSLENKHPCSRHPQLIFRDLEDDGNDSPLDQRFQL